MNDDLHNDIHDHPTVQKLLRSHKRLHIIAIVLAVLAVGLMVAATYDNTIGYDRPAALGN